MQQSEIQFFWPLTEQTPLDLSYEGCDTRPKITSVGLSTGNITYVSHGITAPAVLKLTEDAITFTYKEEPPWYRKLLLNIIGFKWEKR